MVSFLGHYPSLNLKKLHSNSQPEIHLIHNPVSIVAQSD